jgi:Protein of unknown function (DUF4244)
LLTIPRPPREFLLADDGSATVEYVIGLLTAAAFAGVLFVLVQGDNILVELKTMLDQALSVS